MSNQPEIPMTLVESSNVEAIGYDATAKIARVRFKGGATYRYEGVEPELFEIVRSAPSIGKAIGQLKKFPTTKEAPNPEETPEDRLKRLAELEDGCNISVGGLMVDLAKEGTEAHFVDAWPEFKKAVEKNTIRYPDYDIWNKLLPPADDSGSMPS